MRDILHEFGFTAHIRTRGEEAKVIKMEACFKARSFVVERTFAWLSTWRRLYKDYEVLPSSEEAWIYIARMRIMLKRLAQNSS